MLKWGVSHLRRGAGLIEASPLRRVDPRTRLALSLCASVMVMLPLKRLLIFMVGYVIFLAWARLLKEAAWYAWRLRWLLVMLFVVDTIVVDVNLAVIVTLRLLLLTGVLSLFTGVTTPSELRLALEKLRVPYRYAFSLSLAFQSVTLLEEEWRAIREAQATRGALPSLIGGRRAFNLRALSAYARDLVALTAPAIVLTTRRAWATTEAACARGLEAPTRRPYRQLALTWRDWALIIVAAGVCVALFWRW